MKSFYTEEELKKLNLKTYGKNVLISQKASLYGNENISLGSNVRIDDFCILSGKIEIGDYVHIAAYTAFYGSDIGIKIGDYGNVSSRVSIYAISDDYSGESLTNPMIPDKYKELIKKEVKSEKHIIIGTGSVILPGVLLKEGTAVGAMSLMTQSTESWSIYAGIPGKKIKERSRKLLGLEEEFMKENDGKEKNE